MSSAPNNRGRSFAFRLNSWFAATVTLLALALFFAAYFMLSASIAQKEREVIRAQLDLYRSWYEDGGLAGLSQRFAERLDSGRESFFVRVAGPTGGGILIGQPAGSAPLVPSALDALAAAPREWTQLPAGARSGPWLVATMDLGERALVASGQDHRGARDAARTFPRGCSCSASRSACSLARSSPGVLSVPSGVSLPP